MDSKYYGDPDAYAKAFMALTLSEDRRSILAFTPLPTDNILNELAMEVAYRLTQAVYTTPMPMGLSPVEPVLDENIDNSQLFGPLRDVREDLFSGGETPPHNLPEEIYPEEFWNTQFNALEERIWIEFLLYLARTCFLKDESVLLSIRAIAHLFRGIKGNFAEVYGALPSEEDIKAAQNAWNKFYSDKKTVESLSDFNEIAKKCLREFDEDEKKVGGLTRFFASYALGNAMNALFDNNPATAGKSFEEHENWIESFFRDGSGPTRCEQEFGNALASTPAMWSVVIPMRSRFNTPIDLPELSLKIESKNPDPSKIPDNKEFPQYFFFTDIQAHGPRSARAVAYEKLNVFLNGLALTLRENPDVKALQTAFCRKEKTVYWNWTSDGRRAGYPSQALAHEALAQVGEWSAKLIELSKKNQLAACVLEALRLYRGAKTAEDNQSRFTGLWLLVDLFLQHSNNPEKDLPLYQLIYVPRNSPVMGTPEYAQFQKKRLELFKKDTKKFWEIRNNGSVHHGKYPRWERRALNIWTKKLEDAAVCALRYYLNTVLQKNNSKEFPKECLEKLQEQFKQQGVLT